MNKLLLYTFFLLSLINLYAEYCRVEWLILASKPLLVSILAIWFYREVRPLSTLFTRFIFVGLLFSVGGDTLLMFVENGPRAEVFFLLGLGSFLLAQGCYAFAFFRYPEARQGFVSRQPGWAAPFLFYLVGMLVVLWSGIAAEMRPPVAVYATAIVGMALAAANLYGRIPSAVFWGLMSGVLLFVLSDTLIAINKFVQPLAYARVSIMATYLSAQFLIVWYARRMTLGFGDRGSGIG